MNYTVFGDHMIGESHIREGMECEDFSGYYCDPSGRYMIAVICDGHSDPKCFRSAVGARLGCEAVTEILQNLFEVYCAEPESARKELTGRQSETLSRVRTAIVQEWNQRVNEDLRQHPVTAEEYASLDKPQYRSAMKYYQAGKGLNHIYGATMLAAAACQDFYLLMQIGDGAVICLDGNGSYTAPLKEDDRDEMEGPASLCDGDLLTRKRAFRIGLFPGSAQAVFVTSDGIGSTPLTPGLREHLCTLQRELVRLGEEEERSGGLSEFTGRQTELLQSFLSFYTHRGVKDDCCLSGFFRSDLPVSEVLLEPEEIAKLYEELDCEQKEREGRYQEARSRLLRTLDQNAKKLQENESEIASLQKKIEALKDASGGETEGQR